MNDHSYVVSCWVAPALIVRLVLSYVIARYDMHTPVIVRADFPSFAQLNCSLGGASSMTQSLTNTEAALSSLAASISSALVIITL